MPKESPLYQQHRRTTGNHTNLQDKKQGSQQDQDKRVQRLARQPGLNTGNVNRQNTIQAMVQLLSVLSAAQISSANPAMTSQRADELSRRNLWYGDNYSRSQGAERPVPIRDPGGAMSSTSAPSAISADSLSPSASSVNAEGYQNPQSPLPSVNISAMSFPDRYEIFSALRQKRSVSSRNIPNKILDIMSESRFDYQLRNTLDNIFRLAERAPDVRDASVENKNLFLLLKCIQQMNLFIKDNNLPDTDQAQEMLDALLNVADRLDTPHEKVIVSAFKQHFEAERDKKRPISLPMPDVIQRMNSGGDTVVITSDDQSRITLAEQKSLVDGLLIEALDYYGLNDETHISDERKMTVLAAYLNLKIFGMSLDKWCVTQLNTLKSDKNLPFTNGYLRECLYKEMNHSRTTGVALSREERAFYQNHILIKLLPTLTLHLNAAESEALSNINITQPRWGFIHAGAMLLSDSGAELGGLTLTDIEDVGITLHSMLRQKVVPPKYFGYFRLPALLCYVNDIYVSDLSALNAEDMQQVYARYLEYINYWEKKNNPLTQLSNLMQNWKTRTVLAREILLKEFNISVVSDRWVTSYLNGHTEKQYLLAKELLAPDFPDVPGYPELRKLLVDDPDPLPDINTVFEEQNRQLANAVGDIEELILPEVFRSINENEQRFIEQSKVDRVSFVFSVKFSRMCCYSPSLEGTVVRGRAMPRYAIPDQIDMLACTSNNEERIYALAHSSSTGTYTLRRVDRNREALLSLLDKSRISISNPDYIPSRNTEYSPNVIGRYTLKEPYETSQKFIKNLTDYRKKRLMKELYDQGYDQTTQEKVIDFTLSLIPFYSCITERIKGNTRASNIACAIDTLFMIPFAGQLVSTGVHFGTALGRSTVMAIRYGTRQASIKGMLKQTGKGLMTHFPAVAQEISPQVMIGLGNGFLSSIDPGFELLAKGGAKGISAIGNVISRIPNKSAGINRLSAALGNLEAATGKLRRKGQSVQNLKGKPETPSQMNDEAASILREDVVKKIGAGWFSDKNVAKRYIDGSSYIQYYTQFLNDQKNSETLIVSSHGGYTFSDINAPVIILPSDITIKLLTPHGTMLQDPGLGNVVNAGNDLKAYLTITEGEVTNVDFLPQEGNPHWLMPEDYDPDDIYNTLGREDGLQNYRQLRYEGESDKLISKVLIENRKLAKNGMAILTDVLTVDKTIRYVKESSLEKASVQRVIDLDKAGKLKNEKGERYKTIAFCHCRNGFFRPKKTTSTYFMHPAQLEDAKEMTSSRHSKTSLVKLTILYREDVRKEFEIKYLTVGRFIFTLVQQSSLSTLSPLELASLNQTTSRPFNTNR